MKEQICLKCLRVFLGNGCCGQTELFDPCKHGRLLVSGANSWRIVSSKWRDHPFFVKVSEELREHNCSSAPTAMNVAIQRLLEQNLTQNSSETLEP